MKTLDFRKLPLKDALVLKQTLSAAKALSKELPVMFSIDEVLGEPSATQIALTEDVLSSALTNWKVKEYDMPLIGGCLRFMLQEFRAAAEGDPDYLDDSVPTNEYLQRMYGIYFSSDFEGILAKYVIMFEQGLEYWATPKTIAGVEVTDLRDYADYRDGLNTFEIFVNRALNNMFSAEMTTSNIEFECFDISVELYGHKFILGNGAAEYNGLLEYIKSIKEDQ